MQLLNYENNKIYHQYSYTDIRKLNKCALCFLPCIVIQLCNVNQQNELFKLMF